MADEKQNELGEICESRKEAVFKAGIFFRKVRAR